MNTITNTKVHCYVINVSFVLACLIGSLLSAQASANNRIALVIGNADYPDMPLKNPRNDAEAMERTLIEAGFNVVTALDADLETMQSAMLKFVGQLNRNSTALVFYAGHGMQANGRNYLLPVDAQLETERSLRFQALELADLLEELDASDARIKMVILDACRNNPFERSMRGAGRGLAAVDAARGTLIAYATSPGSTASDGDGDNGLYTQSLLKALSEPGLKVEEVFKKVRIQVADASQGAQIPWESSSLTGDFIFIENLTVEAPNSSTQDNSANQLSLSEQDREALYWSSVKDSGDKRMFQSYIDNYPNGSFVQLAELYLTQAQEREKEQALAAANKASKKPAKKPYSKPSAAPIIPQPVLAVSEVKTAQTSNSVGQAIYSCSDLSGEWQNSNLQKIGCAPKKLMLSAGENNEYEVYGSGCAVAFKGKAKHIGDTLEVKWKMASCKGVTTYKLDAQCNMGNGPIKVKRGLTCFVGDDFGMIKRPQ